jgi:hypothetical protein
MTNNAQVTKQERLLNRAEAAQYLSETWRIPCSVGTLAKLAVIGSGPEFRKAGRTPLYPQDGLDAYAQSKISRRVRSTSELAMSESVQAKMAAA